MQTLAKIYSHLLLARFKLMDKNLSITQFGFRAKHSTTDALHVIRRILDQVLTRKDKSLHLLFLDWAKAFDKIDQA